MRRKHKTAVLQGLRSEHLKMDMPNLIKKANELHVALIDEKGRKKLKKINLVNSIIESEYEKKVSSVSRELDYDEDEN